MSLLGIKVGAAVTYSPWASSEASSHFWLVTLRAVDSCRWAMPWRTPSFSAQGSFTCCLKLLRQFRGWSNIPLTLLATEGLEERSASSCCCSSIVSCSKPPARSGQGGVWAYQPIYPLLLLAVLSIHSIIADVALGLEFEVAVSMLIMLGMLFHKSSAAGTCIVDSVAHCRPAPRRVLRFLQCAAAIR